VKVDGPLVNYTTWWLDDVCTSGGPLRLFVPRCTFMLFRALFDLILLRIALRLHFWSWNQWLGRGLGWVLQKITVKLQKEETCGYMYVGVRG